MRKFFRYALIIVSFPLAGILFCNIYINLYSGRYLYENSNDLPASKYGLVLGTSKYLVSGGVNEFFTGRVKSSANLYHMGKIQKIIVSGYRESRYYNEPEKMKEDLLALGVPKSQIVLDSAGDRTILSVQNLSGVQLDENIIIISQKAHNQRAVFIARKAGIKAIGYNVPVNISGKIYLPYIREIFAKVLAFWEMLWWHPN